jgi:hypothetical protein
LLTSFWGEGQKSLAFFISTVPMQFKSRANSIEMYISNILFAGGGPNQGPFVLEAVAMTTTPSFVSLATEFQDMRKNAVRKDLFSREIIFSCTT